MGGGTREEAAVGGSGNPHEEEEEEEEGSEDEGEVDLEKVRANLSLSRHKYLPVVFFPEVFFFVFNISCMPQGRM